MQATREIGTKLNSESGVKLFDGAVMAAKQAKQFGNSLMLACQTCQGQPGASQNSDFDEKPGSMWCQISSCEPTPGN